MAKTTPTAFTFPKMIERLMHGTHSARRPDWPAGVHVAVVSGFLAIRKLDAKVPYDRWTVSSEDLAATDWQIAPLLTVV